MRIKVRHETTYRYDTPATAVIQLLRLTPRGHEGLFVRHWRVETDADSKLERSEDAYGNVLHSFTVDGPVSSLAVLVEGDVETTDTAGLISGATERFPPVFWLRETPLTAPGPEIRSLARDLASGEGGDTLATLHAINQRLFTGMRFSVDATHSGTTARDSFAAAAGVCQDYAHIFAAAARSIDIPARYAGGYYLRTDGPEQEAGHAWAEAYVPGMGWVGFDPVHGVCVTERYVRVAAGLDYLDAAPIRGARIGGASEHLSVTVHVSQGPVILET